LIKDGEPESLFLKGKRPNRTTLVMGITCVARLGLVQEKEKIERVIIYGCQ
jgi:hypothetical protein